MKSSKSLFLAPLFLALSSLANAEAPRFVVCNNGDMEISKVKPQDNASNEYQAVVKDLGVTLWFLEQLKTEACGPSYFGGTACTRKAFPYEAVIKTVDRDTALVVSGLRYNESDKSFSSSQNAFVNSKGDGYELTLGNSYMPNSHTNLVYQIGSWNFESCKALR